MQDYCVWRKTQRDNHPTIMLWSDRASSRSKCDRQRDQCSGVAIAMSMVNAFRHVLMSGTAAYLERAVFEAGLRHFEPSSPDKLLWHHRRIAAERLKGNILPQ